MDAGTGLTARQKKFLELVLQERYLLKRFYLTGGTALACWYLQHRESDDLDFFSEIGEVNSLWLLRWLKKNRDILGYQSLDYTEQLGFHFFSFVFAKNELLKVDFSYFPSPRIEKGINWRGLQIDSLYDIAINKFQTITSSPRAKDYIDLYFILKKEGLKIEKIRQDAALKFGIHVDTLHLARQFLRLVEFTECPKMLVPFKRREMEEFFLGLAKGLKKEIFR